MGEARNTADLLRPEIRCLIRGLNLNKKVSNLNINLKLVQDMHQKFGISHDDLPDFTQGERLFRISAMLEELSEFTSAPNKAEELDALVDLIVFAYGTVDRMGYADAFDEAFSRVMKANIAKELGANSKRGGFQIDLVKPEGWTAPQLNDLVGE